MKAFLVNLAICVAVLWGVFTILPYIKLPAFFEALITVVVVVSAVVWILRRIP